MRERKRNGLKTLAIKKAFEQEVSAGIWHAQLVQEILGEDQSPGCAERMEKLLPPLRCRCRESRAGMTFPGAATSFWMPCAVFARWPRESEL